MSLLRTVLLDYKLIQTADRTRSLLQSDNVSYLSETGLEIKEGSLTANSGMIFVNINVLFVRCNAPLQATINNGTAFTIASALINFGAIANFNLINNSNAAVDYVIVSA